MSSGLKALAAPLSSYGSLTKSSNKDVGSGENSRIYLEENNNVHRFVVECVVKDKDGFFTLLSAKQLFKMLEYPCDKISMFKADLEKALGKSFLSQKKVNGVNHRNVMDGYKLIDPNITDDIDT